MQESSSLGESMLVVLFGIVILQNVMLHRITGRRRKEKEEGLGNAVVYRYGLNIYIYMWITIYYELVPIAIH